MVPTAVRLTKEQIKKLDAVAFDLQKSTGVSCSRSDAIRRFVQMGLDGYWIGERRTKR